MSVSNIRPRTAYGITDALLNTPPMPIISKRAPLTSDMAPLGQIWIYTTTNTPYILTSIVSNLANWTLLVASGGAGVFTSVTAATTVTAGTGITSTTGNIAASSGNVSASGTIDAGTSMLAGTTVTATTNVVAGMQVIAGTTLVANGDTPGTTGVSISDVVDTTQGAGALTILSPSATSHTNTGLIKFYVGATPVYVPYFATIT
jgi:hypothetical protein